MKPQPERTQQNDRVHGRVDGRATVGLRERKKAKTRAAIRRHALRLFREQGYDATTVDQIAAAAEISQNTLFRYFPTKAAIVLQDEYDPLIIHAFQAQPAQLSPLLAMRAAMRQVWADLPQEQAAQERERQALILATPALRAVMLDEFARTIRLLAEITATRVGRRADDLAVRSFAGAVIGAAMAALFAAADDPTADVFALLDATLAHLEAGLPL